MKFIVYSDSDSGEVLVCTEQTETVCLGEWFEKGTGRDSNEYEREEVAGSAVLVSVNQTYMRVRGG